MFIRKIKKSLHKKFTRKSSLILLGDFNMTLWNEDGNTGNNGFHKLQEKHFHDSSNTYSRTNRAYTSASLRVDVKIDNEINTFSDHFQTILIKREQTNFKKGKGYWILNYRLLQDKEYIQHNRSLRKLANPAKRF